MTTRRSVGTATALLVLAATLWVTTPFVAAPAGAAVAPSPACTHSWIGLAFDDEWSSPGNWTPDEVPGPGSVVCIPQVEVDISAGVTASVSQLEAPATLLTVESGATLTVAAASVVGALTVAGGVVAGAGDVTVSERLAWSGGAIEGTGTLVVQTRAVLDGGRKDLFRPLRNEGQTSYVGGQLFVHPGSGIVNAAGAELQHSSTSSIQLPAPPASPPAGASVPSAVASEDDVVLRNEGLLTVEPEGTAGIDGVLLDNAGEVRVVSGNELRLGAGTHTSNGTIDLTSGARLQVDGDLTLGGDSNTRIGVQGGTSAGRIDVDGTATLAGTLEIVSDGPPEPTASPLTFVAAAVRAGTFEAIQGEGWAVDYTPTSAALVPAGSDPDPVPPLVSILPQSVPEAAGSAVLFVQGIGGNVPITVPVVVLPGTASLPEDASIFATTLQVLPNATVPLPITLVDDALDEEDETFTLFVGGAQATITLLDDDLPPVLRIGDGPQVQEGDGGPAELVFAFTLEDLAGEPIRSGREVSFVVSTTTGGTAEPGVDFSPDSLLVSFPAGDEGVTFHVPILGNAVDQPDRTVEVEVSSPTNVTLGPVTTVLGTILDDDDDPPPPTGEVATQLNEGRGALAAALPGWGGAFDLDGFDLPALGLTPFETPVVTDELASALGTEEALDAAGAPFDEVDGDVAEIVADLQAAGITIDWAVGGVGGTPTPPEPTDLLQARTTITLGELAVAAGFTGDDLNDDAELLTGLADALDLDADLELTADLVLTLVFGVDAEGFYLASDSRLRLDVDADGTVEGEGSSGGAPVTIDGTAAADLAVTLAPTGGPERLRLDDLASADPFTLLRPGLGGSADVELDLTVDTLDMTWTAHIDVVTGSGGTVTTPTTASVDGTLDLPGFRLGTSPDATPARITFAGDLAGGVWQLEGEADVTTDLTVDGYEVRTLEGSATIGPDDAEVAARIGLAFGDGPIAVDAEVDVRADGWSGTATVATDELAFGPVRIDEPSVTITAVHQRSPESTVVSVSVTAADGQVDGPDGPGGEPLVRLSGLGGSIDSTGRVCVEADELDGTIGDALTFTATEVEVCSPGPDGIILRIGSATAVAPELGDLSVEITDLVLDAQGRFGADSVAVEQPDGIVQSLGLAGLVPVDVTSLVLSFPDQDEEGRIEDLSNFIVALEGTVDLSDLSGLPFVPVLQIGGDVITPDSSPEERRISFSAEVDGVDPFVVRPLDLGPITLGFTDLEVGDYELSGQLTADGYVDGVLQPGICLEAEVTAGFDDLDVEGALEACGSITETPDGPAVDLAATVSASLAVRGGVEIEDLTLSASISTRVVDGGIEVGASLDAASVGRVTIPFGDIATLQVTDVSVDLTPGPGDLALAVGGSLGEAGSGAGVVFGDGLGPFAGWGGRAGGFGLTGDMGLVASEGFFVDVTVPDGERFGLPAFVPLEISRIGISLPGIPTGDVPEGFALTPELLEGLRLRISGGLAGTPGFPISASVDGLEIDLGRLLAFDPLAPLDLDTFPITNLDGVGFGIEPAVDLGGLKVGGELRFGIVTAGATPVLYAHIRGDVSSPAFQAGAEVVVSQYGPVLLRVTAPLGVPLGPTGLVLRSVTGAATFGPGGTITPPRDGHPEDLLGELFDLPTDVQVDAAAIQAAIAPSVAAGTPTWDQGFAIALQGDLTHVAAAGMIEGNVTLATSFGAPEGGGPSRVQLVGRGDISAFGIPLAEGVEIGGELAVAGILLDFADPLAPSIDLAFESPVAGSPLAVVFPARALVAAQLRTDGVITGISAGLATFVEQAAEGSIAVGGDLFAAAFEDLAADLEANRSGPLARLVLPPEDPGTIDAALLRTRLLALLSDPGTAAQVAGPLLQAVGASVAQSIDDGSFGVSAAAAADALYDVVSDAAAEALLVAGEEFDPSFTFRGALQPLLLGIPVGSPTTEVEVALDRQSLRFELTTSMVENLKVAARQIPGVGPFAEQLITIATLGGRDSLTFGVQVPTPDLISILLAGGELDTLDPSDPGQGWSITVGGGYEVFGMRSEVTGFMTAPDNATFVDTKVEKRWLSDGTTPPDPTRIQITRPQDYDNLIRYGGIVLDGRVEVPRLLTDPVDVLGELPPIPDDALGIGDWLADGAAVLGQTETPLRMTAFAPGLDELLAAPSEAAAEEWADAFVVTGVFEGTRQTPTSPPVARLLSLPVGEGRMLATTAGLEVTGNVPLLGLDGTFVLRVDDRDGVAVPAGGLELDMSAAEAAAAFADLGFPTVFDLDATASVRAFTPAFDPSSSDALRRRGGIGIGATLDAPGFVEDAAFDLVVDPVGTGAGPDFTATASVDRIGPFSGTEIRDATLTVTKEGSEVSIRVQGAATIGGAEVTVDGFLDPDLTGQLVFTAVGGSTPTIGGLRFVEGGLALTLSRDGDTVVGEIGVGGTVELPAFLADRGGAATATAAGCLGTDGDVELRLGISGLRAGPAATISGTGAALPIDPDAPCTLPPGTPDLPTSAARIVVRTTGGTTRVVVDGAIRIVGSGLPALTVTGDLATNGAGSLDVRFGSGLSLSGFSVRGGGTLTFNRTSFTVAVDGQVTIPNLVTDARVTGTMDNGGIQTLAIAVTGLSLPPLQVSSASPSLNRTAPSTYVLDTTLVVTVPGLRQTGSAAATVTATGRISSNGDFDIDIAGTGFTVNGTGVTSANLDLARTGTTLRVEVAASFALWGSTLSVSGQVTVGPNGMSGAVDLRTPGGPISVGGWAIGGDLEIAFSVTTSPAGFRARVSLVDGTVTVPGVGSLVANADMATDGSGSISISTPTGIRLGGSSSPFVGFGTFSLRQVGGVVTFSASNVSVRFVPVGGTEAFRVTAPTFSISSNGAFSISTQDATIGSPSGLRLVIPSASFAADAGGTNVRLAVGAGSLTVPGLLDGLGGRPSPLSTPAFTIGTGAFRYVLFDARTVDLGLVRLNGRLVFERTSSGVFRLEVEGNAGGPANLDLGQLGRIDLGDFFIASDGSFSITASTRRIGLTNPIFEIRDASFTFRQSGGVLELSVSGGDLRIPSLSQPIALPTLSIRVGTTFTQTFTLPALTLGPFFRSSSASFVLSLGRTSSSFALVEPAGGGNNPSVTAFAGSTSLTLNTFSVTSGGTFTGSVTGRLALFGDRISQTTLDVRLANGILELSLPSSRAATLDIGFIDFRVSGTARSDGTFSFTGSSSTSGNVVGVVSWNGDVSVTVADTGVRGSYSGAVSFAGLSGTASGSMSSTGEVTGSLGVDLNLDGRTTGFSVCGPFGCTFTSERVSYSFDIDGTPASADTTPPTMSQPANVSIATSQSAGSIPVSYTQPSASDSRDGTLAARCTPGSGSLFAVGATTTVSCTARDAAGNSVTRTFTVTVTFSAALVVLEDGIISADLGGFKGASTTGAFLFSDPISLAEETTDAAGRVRYEIELPTGLVPGDHHLVVAGVDPDDAERLWVVPVTVGPDGTVTDIRVDAAVPDPEEPPTDDPTAPTADPTDPGTVGRPASPSGRTPSSAPLARTGSDLASPVRWGLLLLVLGAILVARTRRRTETPHREPAS